MQRSGLIACTLSAALLGMAAPAQAIKIATWNLLQYPQTNLAARQPNFRTVMAGLNPDVLITQELDQAAGRDSFLNNVLNVIQPGEWNATGWISLSFNEGGAIFYKPAKVTIFNVGTLGTSGPRSVLLCGVRPVGYGNSTFFRLYSVHFKAGNPSFTPSDSTTRRIECTSLRNSLNTIPAGTAFLIGGDTNFYGAWEGGYIALTESQDDNDGRGDDPLTMPGTWNSIPDYAINDTQCPCLNGCGPGFSGGGMDDRFDLWLTSYSMQDGEGFDLVPNTYTAYGNDGQHFNNDINAGGFNNAVGITIANALHEASDHIPVVITVQVPAKVSAASALDFGSVIIGTIAQRVLTISNAAIPPADELNYSFTAPSNFVAPGGSFTVNAAGPPNNPLISMDTGATGDRAGTLTIASDDPDSASKSVLLSGKVVRHAVASLDSLAIRQNETLYLGNHTQGEFPDSAVRVFNLGYDSFQARLSVNSGLITGGDGRFSLVPAFAGALVAGAPVDYVVHFDDQGATPDSTYQATLRLGSADEPLPGGAPQPDLVVSLGARPISSPTGLGSELPMALRFYPPHPNPAHHETWFDFDLRERGPVTLDVFDLSGRRVQNVISGTIEAGHHRVSWKTLDATGARLHGGLYFARFSTPGLTHIVRIAVLP